MPYNFSYKLKPNPNLTSVGNIRFDPVTDEHKDLIAMAKKRSHYMTFKTLIIGIIFLIISVSLLSLGLFIIIKYPSIGLLFAVLASMAVFFGVIAVICISCYPFKVTGIKEAVVSDRETHQYDVENEFSGATHQSSTDYVTLKFNDNDMEVRIVTDAKTQMHCIPGKTVYLLRTNKGPIISVDD